MPRRAISNTTLAADTRALAGLPMSRNDRAQGFHGLPCGLLDLHDGMLDYSTAGLAVGGLKDLLLEPTAGRVTSASPLCVAASVIDGQVTSAVMAWSFFRLSFSLCPVICGHLRSLAGLGKGCPIVLIPLMPVRVRSLSSSM